MRSNFTTSYEIATSGVIATWDVTTTSDAIATSDVVVAGQHGEPNSLILSQVVTIPATSPLRSHARVSLTMGRSRQYLYHVVVVTESVVGAQSAYDSTVCRSYNTTMYLLQSNPPIHWHATYCTTCILLIPLKINTTQHTFYLFYWNSIQYTTYILLVPWKLNTLRNIHPSFRAHKRHCCVCRARNHHDLPLWRFFKKLGEQ